MDEFLTPADTLWALFGSSFLSATLFPGGSEVLLLGLAHTYPELIWHGWVVASIGNTLGAMSGYVLGRFFPKKATDNRAIRWCEEYGVWILLLSWMPVLGDALAVAAGWLRINWFKSLILLLIGKTLRYLALILGFEQVMLWIS